MAGSASAKPASTRFLVIPGRESGPGIGKARESATLSWTSPQTSCVNRSPSAPLGPPVSLRSPEMTKKGGANPPTAASPPPHRRGRSCRADATNRRAALPFGILRQAAPSRRRPGDPAARGSATLSRTRASNSVREQIAFGAAGSPGLPPLSRGSPEDDERKRRG